MRCWGLVIGGIALAGAVSARAEVAAVAGAGSRSCAQMSADIAELPNVRRSYVAWMQGYLSAMNTAREARQLSLVDVADYEIQWQWLVNWCADRPDSSFAEATRALFSNLAREQGER